MCLAFNTALVNKLIRVYNTVNDDIGVMFNYNFQLMIRPLWCIFRPIFTQFSRWCSLPGVLSASACVEVSFSQQIVKIHSLTGLHNPTLTKIAYSIADVRITFTPFSGFTGCGVVGRDGVVAVTGMFASFATWFCEFLYTLMLSFTILANTTHYLAHLTRILVKNWKTKLILVASSV